MLKPFCKRGSGLAIATIACFAVFGVSAALAANPHCGDTIKKDVKLSKDLDCSASSSDGLVIGANKVTIDLNGHKIIGLPSGYDGVNDGGGWDSLTLKDGTISGFAFGLYADSASKVHVSNVKFKLKGTNDYAGILVSDGQGPQITKTKVDNAQQAFILIDTPGLSLTKSKVTGSDDASTTGVVAQVATGVIDDVEANGTEIGAFLAGPSSGLVLKNSSFNNAGSTGVVVQNAVPLFQYDYTLRNNVANNAGGIGFYAAYDVNGGGNKAKNAGTQNFHNVPH